MAFETIDIQDISGFQSITIPENFKINDDKVYLKKVGNALYIIPFHNPWQNLIDSVSEFSQDFMNDRAQPTDQARESFDK
jgi:antitoxin VapB